MRYHLKNSYILSVIGIFGIISILLLSGCVETKEENLNITITKISTEKPRYTANELIKIYIDIDSNADVKNATLNVYGITSRQGQHLMNIINPINLTKGTNKFNFNVTAPFCTHGCGARYFPGNYLIYASVSYTHKEKNISISETKNITVELY